MKTKTVKFDNFMLSREYTVKVYLGKKSECIEVFKKVSHTGDSFSLGITCEREDAIYVILNEENTRNLIGTYIHELTHVVDTLADQDMKCSQETGVTLKPRILRYLVEKTKSILSDIEWTLIEEVSSRVLEIYNIDTVKMTVSKEFPEFDNTKYKKIYNTGGWRIFREFNNILPLVYIKSNSERLENMAECLYTLVLSTFLKKKVKCTEARAYATGALVSSLVKINRKEATE